MVDFSRQKFRGEIQKRGVIKCDKKKVWRGEGGEQ